MQGDANVPRLRGHIESSTIHRNGSSDEVRQYADTLRRRWWVIAAAAVVALGAAWWGERGKLPVYTAEVLLEQRREAPLVGFAPGGGMGPDFEGQVEVIRSRAVAAMVVDSLGLQLVLLNRPGERSRIIDSVEADREGRPGSYTLVRAGARILLFEGANANGDTIATSRPDDWISGPGFRLLLADPAGLDLEPLRFAFQDHQVAVERLQGRVRVNPGRAPGLVRIGYTDPDPHLAAAVVNGMAASYQVHRAQGAREQASRRREVIAGQLVGLADSLEAAQTEVVDYQRQTQFLNPSYEGGEAFSTVINLENELRTFRFQEGLLASLVAGLQSGEGGDESLHQILSLGSDLVPAGPALHQRLQELEVERARMTASTFGRLEGDPGVQVVDSLITSTRAQIRTAAEQGLGYLRERIAGTERRLAEMRGSMSAIPGQTAELARLRQRADAVQDVVDALVDRYYEAQIAEAVEAGDVAVIDPAIVPLWPDASRTPLVLMVGLLGGLLIGGLAVLAMEYLDLKVRRAVDAEEVTGLPLVAMVPRLRSSTRDPVGTAIAREAFRSLRTNLRFAHATAPRVIALSSATPKEGKTTVAVNLAASLAEQQGSETVLLIDADLRRPQVHKLFGLDRGPGLAELLLQEVEPEAVIQASPVHPRLHVLSCGGAVANPSELIASKEFERLLHRLREQFDFIVIDTPPLLAVADGTVIAKAVDGTLIVVRANQADRHAVTHAMEQLRQLDVDLLGVILNAVGPGSGDRAYAYQYYEDYLTPTPDDRESAREKRTRSRLLLGSASDTE